VIIVALTDLHGHIGAIERFSEKLKEADVVILTGDITHFGRRSEANDMVEAVTGYCGSLFAVPGNCDYPEVGEFLTEKGQNLDSRYIELDEVVLAGVGGSLQCPGRTPNERSEDEFSRILDGLRDEIPSGKPIIFATHQPPYNTCCDIAKGGIHVGSRSLRRFVEDVKPVLCLSGHIHEATGVGRIGDAPVINPGPLFFGGYARVLCDGSEVTAEVLRAF